MSAFLKRLRTRCPSVASLLKEGVHILRAWNSNTFLGIDFTERSHNTLRLELRGTKARSTTVGSNRVFLQQAAAEHRRRFGFDVSRLAVRDILTEQPPADRNAKTCKKAGGNARISFRNHELHACKPMKASSRALTQEELDAFALSEAAEWASLSEDQRQLWAGVHLSESINRQVMAMAPALDRQPGAAATNLWGQGGGPLSLMPPSAIVDLHAARSRQTRRASAQHDPSLLIQAPVPNRVAELAREIPDRVGATHSCWEAKKNVCRAVLAEDTGAAMDDLTAQLNS